MDYYIQSLFKQSIQTPVRQVAIPADDFRCTHLDRPSSPNHWAIVQHRSEPLSLHPSMSTKTQRFVGETNARTMAIDAGLLKAAADGNDGGFKRLLCTDVEFGIYQDKVNWLRMLHAAKRLSPEVMSFLARAGAHGVQTQHMDHEKRTLHHHVLAFADVGLLMSLIWLGFKTNVKNASNESPLMLAVGLHRHDLCVVLMAHGAKVQQTCGDLEQTPLHTAAFHGDVALCRTLIAGGADPTARDTLSRSPLHMAAMAGHADVISLLAEHHAAQEDIHRAVWPAMGYLSALDMAVKVARDDAPQAIDALKLLIQLGADRQCAPEALHSAAQFGHCVAAQVLVDAGWDVNRLNGNGQTPLHCAALFSQIQGKSSKLAIAYLLLAKGAAVEPLDSLGQTPLHIAASAGGADLCFLLMKAGADPCQKRVGVTAAGAAGRHKHTQVADQIKAYIEAQRATRAVDDLLGKHSTVSTVR